MVKRLLNLILRPAAFVPAVMLVVSLVELAVADRKYGLFTGGFGQPSAVDAPGELALFVVGFVVAQVAAGLIAWRIAVWLARRSGEAVAMIHFAFLYGGISLLALTLQYQLHSYFSDAVSFALLSQLGGGSAGDALLFAKNEIALGLGGAALFCAMWWIAVKLVRRVAGHADPSKPRWKWLATTWAVLIVAVLALPRTGSDGAHGLERILVWNGTSSLIAEATDFDGDGYGLAGRQLDGHPFDGARHPLALDIPGNGVDEDGFGGDLELVTIPQALPDISLDGEKPHVVIVVFESTRFDVIGKRIDGKPVAPNLEKVVAQGGAIAPTYSHVGFTTASLKSLFGGALTLEPGEPSLFRDLKRSGYRIGVFSGQPEDFGGISEATGMRENATFFVDAEMLKDQRAFSFAAQGSLLVDETIILGEFEKALGREEEWLSPQFVYFNFQSPHFPYHHDAVPEVFARPPVKRSEIRADNAARVQLSYWNTVAYADAALGRVIERLKQVGAWDNTVLIVTGDHGEALFENSFLGHGHVIDRLQNGTFLASNRPLGDIDAPISLSDVRGTLMAMLGADVPQPRPHAPFMHIGPLESPTAIGMAHADLGVISLRFDREEACFEKSGACAAYDRLEGAELAAIDELVARWGSERWARRR